MDNYPPSESLQGVGLGGRQECREIIVGENYLSFHAPPEVAYDFKWLSVVSVALLTIEVFPQMAGSRLGKMRATAKWKASLAMGMETQQTTSCTRKHETEPNCPQRARAARLLMAACPTVKNLTISKHTQPKSYPEHLICGNSETVKITSTSTESACKRGCSQTWV